MKVLVAYASRYGSTKGIAEFIGEGLRHHGIQVDVQDVRAVRNPKDYDAFVVGSAVYLGHWMKEARNFASKNRAVLAAHPVWLFSSGPLGTKPTDAKGRDLLEVSAPKELDELTALLKPRDHRVFFGALDSARLKGTHSTLYKLAGRSQAGREAMPEGDFRNWKGIEAWVNGIAEALGASSSGTG